MLTNKTTIIGIKILIVLIISCLLGCSNSSKRQAIESVLEQDYKISQSILQSVKLSKPKDPNNRKEMSKYLKELEIYLKIAYQEVENINLNECPEDFATAYKENCIAIRNYHDLIVETLQFIEKNGFWGQLKSTFVQGPENHMAGLHSEIARLDTEEKKILKAGKNAYQKTLEIASKYGVDTTKYNKNFQ